MRQIVLDTETTGLEVSQGHRVIEIGCVELVKRRYTGKDFHRYLHPEDKPIDPGAERVHGISMGFLADKPRFRELADDLWTYLEGAELIIHNASFDLGFLNMEFARCGRQQRLEDVCLITDTVQLARKLHPGQRVSLDALCKRYEVDNSNRELHGALLDARLLADVYLAMTGGQNSLGLESSRAVAQVRVDFAARFGITAGMPLPVAQASEAEWQAHRGYLERLRKKGKCLWSADLPPPASE